MSVQTEIDRIISAIGAAYDAIEEKGGTVPQAKTVARIAGAVQTIPVGGPSVSPSNITFYDYDGTVVASWTLAELAGKTSLPDYPTHDGLICQGWNWTLAGLKSANRAMNVGAMYITNDGKTRIYIRLEAGRTSPMLGCCPNGTVTVDWGDGTTPDTLTGTSTTTVKWTPNHNYAAPGDYIITLTPDGTVGFYGASSTAQYSGLLRYSSGSDARNSVYQNSIKRIEIGEGVTSIGNSAFRNCYSLASITIPDGVTSIGSTAFDGCSGVAFYDFTSHTTVPTLANTNAFTGIAADCQIRVPAALADEWKAATNWSTYASYIVGV